MVAEVSDFLNHKETSLNKAKLLGRNVSKNNSKSAIAEEITKLCLFFAKVNNPPSTNSLLYIYQRGFARDVRFFPRLPSIYWFYQGS